MTTNKLHIIGDIHGQHDKLVELLGLLGYTCCDGVWGHPTHKAIFVGDLIDRGPNQLKTLQVVRAMVDAGTAVAVMGNHEFNAIAFHTRNPTTPNEHLRKRTAKNRHQHQHFLNELGEDSAQHAQWVHWMMGLPLWWENDHIRVVHACWHAPAMRVLKPWLTPQNTLTQEALCAASEKGHEVFDAVEAICKGLEIDLPVGVQFTDAEGTVRTRTRVRWWDNNAHTYQAAALLPPDISQQLPTTRVPANALVEYDQKKPVFFGHYWFTSVPDILSPMMCCVDYSAARTHHPLVAYCYEGESTLHNDRFVSTAVVHPEPSKHTKPNR